MVLWINSNPMYRLLLKSIQATASFRDADIYLYILSSYDQAYQYYYSTTNSTSSLYTHAGNISSLSSRAQKKSRNHNTTDNRVFERR